MPTNKEINIPIGINVVSNIYNSDIDLNSLTCGNLKTVKTLYNGIWATWTKDTPDRFQTFSTLKRGYGCIAKSDTDCAISIPDNIGIVDQSKIVYPLGLNFIALTKDIPNIFGNVIENIGEVSNIKFIDGEDSLEYDSSLSYDQQDINSLNNGLGYIVKITKKYKTALNDLINTDSRDNFLNGIYNLERSNYLIDKIILNNPVYTVYDADIKNNISLDTVKQMYVVIDNEPVLITFPASLENTKIYLKRTGAIVDNCGLLVETNQNFNDLGYVSELDIDNDDYGSILDNGLTLNRSYCILLQENLDMNIQLFSTYVDLDKLSLIYNILPVIDRSQPKNKMVINIENIDVDIYFYNEYLGKGFNIVKDNKFYSGIFGN